MPQNLLKIMIKDFLSRQIAVQQPTGTLSHIVTLLGSGSYQRCNYVQRENRNHCSSSRNVATPHLEHDMLVAEKQHTGIKNFGQSVSIKSNKHE